jgi:nucleoid-associated protein YgaU
MLHIIEELEEAVLGTFEGVRIHRVRLGETLATLSTLYYGMADYAMVIYRHNTHIVNDPNQIYAGQELVIPWITPGSQVYR